MAAARASTGSDGVGGAGRNGGEAVGAVAGAGGGGVGAVHLGQQLHLLQLLGRHQDAHGPHPAAAQRPLRRQGRRQGLRPPRRPRLRPPPHLAPPRHRLPRGLPRLRRAVARRLQDHLPAALLADVRLPLPRRQLHHLDEHRRARHLHPQLPRQQGARVRRAQGLRRPLHGDIHRRLLRALRRRPRLVPRHARRRSRRRLRRRHGVPPRGPRRRRRRRGRRARLRGHQHARRRHRALPPGSRPHGRGRRRRSRVHRVRNRAHGAPRGPRRRARSRRLDVLDEVPQGGQRRRRVNRPLAARLESGGGGGCDGSGGGGGGGSRAGGAAAAGGGAHDRGGAGVAGLLAALLVVPDGGGHGAGGDEQPGPDGRGHGLRRRLALRLHDQHLGLLRPHRLRHRLRALHQDEGDAAACVERGGAGADVRGVRGDGLRHAGIPLRRLRGGRHLLRRAAGGDRAHGVGAVRAQVLRPHLQHPHPQPAAGLLPLLGAAGGAPVRRGGHQGARRRQHVLRRALLPPRVRRHGRRLRRRLRPRRAPQPPHLPGLRQDPPRQAGQEVRRRCRSAEGELTAQLAVFQTEDRQHLSCTILGSNLRGFMP